MSSRHFWTLTFSILTAVLCKTTKGVTLQMPSSYVCLGDSVTVRCVGLDRENVKLFKDDSEVQRDHFHQITRTVSIVELKITPVSATDYGVYSCVTNGNIQHNQRTLWLNGCRRSISLTASSDVIPDQDYVTLTCSVEDFWNPQWLRRSSPSDSHLEILTETSAMISVSRGGLYSCRWSNELIITEESTVVTIRETGLPLQIPYGAYPGDTVTVRCEGPAKTFLVFYKDGVTVKKDLNHWYKRTSETTVELMIHSVSASDQGLYSCGTSEGTLYTGYTLQIYPGSRSVKLTVESKQGTVRLSCVTRGVNKYEWIRRSQNSTLETLKEDIATITVSRGGVYSCRGKEWLRLTPESDHVTIWETVSNRAVVQPEPAWTEVFSGESLSLRCEVEDGSDSQWSYGWMKNGVLLSTVTREYPLSNVSMSDSGNYICRGMRGSFLTTQWSQETMLQVFSKAVPILSVSPLWLSRGTALSLKCDVTVPSAGWSFFWYQAVPLPSGSYSYELLPGLTSGTTHGSFTVHSLNSTTGFVCRAARGSPEVYTDYSPPQFVWSADAGSRVSPTVRPNSSQHLTYDHVSVSCGSSDEEWRVQMFSLTTLSLHQCPSYATGDRFQCNFNTTDKTRAVFWCESGSGEMSEAVNITIHDSVILLIPAQPVPEGQSVSLTCKVGQSAGFPSVDFYKDGELIQEGSLRTYSISALSKSDEGLYKCSVLTSGQVGTSPESWLSVRLSEESSSSVLVLVLVGAVCLIVLLILLLLLWRYRKTEDFCSSRSQQSNQTSAEDHVTTKSLPEEVTYSQLELTGRKKHGRVKEQEVIYSNVVAQSAADVDVMYSQINHYKKRKATKKSEVKAPDTSAEETVYSEVKKTTSELRSARDICNKLS